MVASPQRPPRFSLAPLGGLRLRGPVALGPRMMRVTLVGGMDLDLREAALPPGGVTIVKVSLVGGVKVVVPPGVRVDVRGVTLIGGRDVERLAGTPPDAPLLRLRVFGVVGGVRVRVDGPAAAG
jgi:Cell wall-active antibiotics response LiaF, C-terminal